jgi:hypothetical protein
MAAFLLSSIPKSGNESANRKRKAQLLEAAVREI